MRINSIPESLTGGLILGRRRHKHRTISTAHCRNSYNPISTSLWRHYKLINTYITWYITSQKYLSSDVTSDSSWAALSFASSRGIDNPNLCSLSWSRCLSSLSCKKQLWNNWCQMLSYSSTYQPKKKKNAELQFQNFTHKINLEEGKN